MGRGFFNLGSSSWGHTLLVDTSVEIMWSFGFEYLLRLHTAFVHGIYIAGIFEMAKRGKRERERFVPVCVSRQTKFTGISSPSTLGSNNFWSG